MSTPPIKPTVHGVDPKQSPVVKDVYHDDVLESANEITQESPVKQAAAEYLDNTNLGTDDIVPTIKDSIGSDSDGATFDFSAAKKRIERAFGANGSTTGLSSKQKRDIGNALETVSNNRDSKLLFNDVEKIIKGGTDNLSAGSIVDTINSISGRGEFFKMLDLGAQAGFIRGITDTIIDWGVPELIDKLLDSLDDAKLKNEMLEENAIRAARNGDVYQTKHFCEKMGQQRSFSIHRDLITYLMKNYKIADGESRSYTTLGNELLNFYMWLSPTWDKDPYDSGLDCLEFYTFANTNAEAVLRHTRVSTNAALGAKVKIEKPLQTAGRLFPKMVEWQHVQ